MTTITLIDESTMGTKHAWNLDVLDETVNLRELLQRRIHQEVSEFNAHQPDYFQGLVQPTDAERTLNGFHLTSHRQLDWQAQYEKALEAFVCHRYIVLVNDRQIDDLDTILELQFDTEVTFFQLVPLVGG